MNNKQTKEELIKALMYTGMHYHSIPEEFKADKDVFLAALKGKSYCPLKFADKTIQDDESMVIASINADSGFEYASERLRKDKRLCLFALQKNGNAIFSIDGSLKDDEDIINAALVHRHDFFRIVGDGIKNNKSIMLKAIQKDADNYRYVSAELKNDRDIALETLKGGYKKLYDSMGGSEIQDPTKLLKILDNSKGISDFSWMNNEPILKKDKKLISFLIPFSVDESHRPKGNNFKLST
jgi:hypothetical protein